MSEIKIKNTVAATISTPSSGTTSLYVDSVTKKLVSKNDAGVETSYSAGGGGGSGDVVGPASAVDSNVAMFDGTTGKLLKDSGLTLSGSNTGDQTSVSGNSGSTDALKSATTTINVVSATAPTIGQVLTATSSTAATWQTPSAASGDVVGPASSTDNALVRFDGTTGKLIQNYTSGAPIVSDAGSMTLDGGADSISSSADMALSLDSTGNNGFTTNGAGSNLAIFNNAAQVLYFTTTQSRYSLPLASANGALSAPTYSFLGMADGGLYRDSGTDTLRMVVNGVLSQTWLDNNVTVDKPFRPGTYTTAGLPAATSFEGHIVYDSTTQTMKWSNGTAWATI